MMDHGFLIIQIGFHHSYTSSERNRDDEIALRMKIIPFQPGGYHDPVQMSGFCSRDGLHPG